MDSLNILNPQSFNLSSFHTKPTTQNLKFPHFKQPKKSQSLLNIGGDQFNGCIKFGFLIKNQALSNFGGNQVGGFARKLQSSSNFIGDQVGGKIRAPRNLQCLSNFGDNQVGDFGFKIRGIRKHQSLINFGGDQVGGCIKFGFWNGGVGKGGNFLRVRALVGVEKVVESEGDSVGMSRSRNYDAIVIGSGIGGLVAATQLAVKGAKVLVLEKYVIPGGSSGFYEREGFKFDVGSSVMFGFSDKGNLNLITQSLAAVGCKLEAIPDPTTVHFHLPNALSVQVHREYSDFVTELVSKFPHEKDGILGFYGECWKVFNALNSLELKSLEEPIYLFGQFLKKPIACLTLAYYLPQNAGDVARRFIKDPELLAFLDAECFIVSTVNALRTPMINASMVLCDRHFGGINYPVGGVGEIAKSLASGLVNQGSEILYKANVTNINIENGKAVGVKLSDGREFSAKTVISNATRWDTFGKLVKGENLPKDEENFQKAYVKAPSFLSIHVGVKAEVLPLDTDCHHFILEDDWKNLEAPYGSIFLSIPTVLDSTLAPEGCHILHIFTTSSIDDWKDLSRNEYEATKELVADKIIARLEKKLFPGLKSSIIFKEVGTPKTHRRYLARDSGTYGPMPRQSPKGLLGMPFNTTGISSLYCVGDSCFPGQGVIAVAFSGVMCAHRVAADLGFEKKSPIMDAGLLRLLSWFRTLA